VNLKKRLSDLVAVQTRSREGRAWPAETVSGPFSGTRFDAPIGSIVFQNAGIDGGDFRGQRFENWLASASTFTGCDFTGTTWGGGVLGDLPVVTFTSCRFERSDLRAVRPQYARFVACSFFDAGIVDWNAQCAEFIECSFRGEIVRAKFSATPWGVGADRLHGIRNRNEFIGNDFSQADLHDCSFTGGIDLEKNRFPRSGYAVIRDAQRQLREALAQLSMEAVRADLDQVVAMLRAHTYGPAKAQDDLFVRVKDLGAAAAFLQLDEVPPADA
jgi:uncharacterized protein YjbI with pentapeptide repeats